MLDASDKFIAFLSTSHTRELRINLWGQDAGGDINYGPLQITRGTLDMDVTSFVGRTLQASVGLDPFGTLNRRAEQALAVENGYLTIDIGMQYPDRPNDPEWIRLGRLRLTRFQPNASLATTQIEAMDRTIMLRDFPIHYGEFAANNYQGKLDAGWDWRAMITDFVQTAMIGETVTYDAGTTGAAIDPKTNLLNVERDAIISEIAEAHGAYLRCDENGALHLTPKPVLTAAVWEIHHGVNGVLVENHEEYARENIYNGIWVEWSQPDKPPPLSFISTLAVDTNPASRTYWNGPFGRRIKVINDIPVADQAAADALAAAHLAASLGRYFNIDITCLANPLLQLGDTIGVQAMDMDRHLRVIERISLPLGPEATMSITTRTATT